MLTRNTNELNSAASVRAMRVLGLMVLMIGVCLLGLRSAQAAIWKGSADIAMIHLEAELNDGQDPVQVFVRVENRSAKDTIKMSRYFIQIADADSQAVRPVAADELVSEQLKHLRLLLPQHEEEINALLKEIRADFPQEKIVEVYARLKSYMQKGRPNTWRTDLENFLLSKREVRKQDVDEAAIVIEDIGRLSQNYFWPNDISPQGAAVGVLYFVRPGKTPPRIYLQVGDQYLGTEMQMVASGKKK